jgi:hypothetical protein
MTETKKWAGHQPTHSGGEECLKCLKELSANGAELIKRTAVVSDSAAQVTYYILHSRRTGFLMKLEKF